MSTRSRPPHRRRQRSLPRRQGGGGGRTAGGEYAAEWPCVHGLRFTDHALPPFHRTALREEPSPFASLRRGPRPRCGTPASRSVAGEYTGPGRRRTPLRPASIGPKAGIHAGPPTGGRCPPDPPGAGRQRPGCYAGSFLARLRGLRFAPHRPRSGPPPGPRRSDANGDGQPPRSGDAGDKLRPRGRDAAGPRTPLFPRSASSRTPSPHAHATITTRPGKKTRCPLLTLSPARASIGTGS